MSLALALGRAGISVALVDASGAQAQSQAPSDARPIALSQSSRRILQTLGLWEALEATLTPIRRIHVSDRGHFGFARMSAEDHGVDALGYVISAMELGEALRAALQSANQVRLLSPAVIDQVSRDHGPTVTLSIAALGEASSQQWPRGMEAKLMVLCDGGRSPLRGQLGVPVQERDYGQWAITARVHARLAHGGVAYERFTAGGPLALLPMQDNDCGLVWSVNASRCETLMALDDDDFLAALGEQFGLRLGGFLSASPRSAFPVRSVTASRVVGARLAVIGNAANHLHPVAGQGLNLGLRDAATLAEVVSACLRDGGDPGDAKVLARYVEWRRGDQQRVARATDALVRLFSNRFPPLVLARGLGLLAFDLLPPIKRRFGRYAMGLEGRQSRLARGLEL
jgi:2-octaprenyl-6-methoxyphenol hydroxylase